MILRCFGLGALGLLAIAAAACGGSTGGQGDPESVIVDYMTALGDPVADRTAVSLRSHDDIYLDMTQPNADARADILDDMRQLGHPMYFEIEPETRLILDYLFPIEGQVVQLLPQQDGLAIHLVTSAAVHFLKSDHPQYDDFVDLLEAALDAGTPVLVTTDMDHGQTVVDVREPLAPL